IKASGGEHHDIPSASASHGFTAWSCNEECWPRLLCPPFHWVAALTFVDPKTVYLSHAGFVNLLRLRRSSGKQVPLPNPTHPLGGPLGPRNFGPTRESLPPFREMLLTRHSVVPG